MVSGYVGNKAAVLPLQLLGFDVDPLLTVQFSNHTGYPSFRGTVGAREARRWGPGSACGGGAPERARPAPPWPAR